MRWDAQQSLRMRSPKLAKSLAGNPTLSTLEAQGTIRPYPVTLWPRPPPGMPSWWMMMGWRRYGHW